MINTMPGRLGTISLTGMDPKQAKEATTDKRLQALRSHGRLAPLLVRDTNPWISMTASHYSWEHGVLQQCYRWGDHYWMLDVNMDCSKTEQGWFEVKAFLTNAGKFYAQKLTVLWCAFNRNFWRVWLGERYHSRSVHGNGWRYCALSNKEPYGTMWLCKRVYVRQ